MSQRIEEVFVNKLLNMPKPYVSRLVSDRKHEILALLTRNTMGGYVIMR